MPRTIPAETPQPRVAPPAKFVGHARIVEYFARIGPAGLGHAYLFHGPAGVGKLTFAKTLALTLHCEHPTSFPLGYCGKCGPCIRGLAGSSADTMLVDQDFVRLADELAKKPERKTDTYGVETSRLIARRMEMRSYEGGRLVCILPSFENVSYGQDQVYNALLKELEEPDRGKVFMMTTTLPSRLLPTIRSRSISIRFDPLRDDEVAMGLVAAGESTERAAAIARLSQGSLGDALEQRDPDVAAFGEAARAWAIACVARPGVLPQMPALDKDDPRPSLVAALRHARIALRDLLAYACVGATGVLDFAAVDRYAFAAAALGDRAAATATAALTQVEESDRIAATNVAPATVLGWLQIRLRSLGG